jgi:hypothetical protein
MRVTEGEAARIRDTISGVINNRLGDTYLVTIDHPKIRDDVQINIRLQVRAPRLTTMQKRYLEMCKNTHMKEEWLGEEVRLDDKVVIIEGCIADPARIYVLLRPKLGRGGLGSSEYHLTFDQMVIVAANSGLV